MVQNMAFYLRLSVEEDKDESTSIANQRWILRQNADSMEEFIGVKITEFVDDGYSGYTFDRPSFKRMIQSVESGLIDCIAVKDFSRLGRDFTTVCFFLENYFPTHGVRFIALGNGFDSVRVTNGLDISTKFVQIMNQYYVEHLSVAITNAFRASKLMGNYLSRVPVFGYKIARQDKRRYLEPDETTAPIVRKIFAMAGQGMMILDIAKELNEEGIPSPGVFLDPEKYKGSIWKGPMVTKILHDVRYLGKNCVQRTQRDGIHGKVSNIPLAEQEYVENAHEPLVTEVAFNYPGKHLAPNRKSNNHRFRVFRGLVKCGYCGLGMELQEKVGGSYYACKSNAYHQDTVECAGNRIDEAELYRQAAEQISQRLGAFHAAESKARNAKDRLICQDGRLKKNVNDLEKRLEILEEQSFRLYDQYEDGALAEAAYQAENATLEAKAEKIKADLDAIQAKLNKAAAPSAEEDQSKDILELAKNFNGTPETLTRELAVALIEKINVRKENRVEIIWKTMKSA
jgi:DNA invertase Pin-like site-specific DNA recombinase